MVFEPAILYVDDEEANRTTFKRAFGSDYKVVTASSGDQALELLQTQDFPIVVADQRMPGMTGIELCEKLIAAKPQTVRMILTAYTETHLLLNAINRGHVRDYIVKPWKKSDVKPILDRAFADFKEMALRLEELQHHATQTKELKETIAEVYDAFPAMEAGPGLAAPLATLKKAAPADSTILIQGETGTGKEVLARQVHQLSPRSNRPFVAVHCAALAKNILESELFGHEKGAFTGADQLRIGRFEAASGGTLFLDEVGEIPENLQVKLLRVLQEKQIQRVGSNVSIAVDVRLVCATHRDLKKQIREGKFREDLYYRLNVIPVLVPPLRERKDDILGLAKYFLQKFNRQTGKTLVFSPLALELLVQYDWPGNVRELQNIVERAVVLGEGSILDPEDLYLEATPSVSQIPLDRIGSGVLREEIHAEEMRMLTDALRRATGNISEAARILEVPRSTLFHRLKKFKII